MKNVPRLLLSLLVLFAFTATLSAQTFRGGINGTVTDVQGALVANAAVVATETSTGVAHSTKASMSWGVFVTACRSAVATVFAGT